MVKDIVTEKEAKLKFAIIGEYNTLQEFLEAVIDLLAHANKEGSNNELPEPSITNYPVVEPSEVRIFV